MALIYADRVRDTSISTGAANRDVSGTAPDTWTDFDQHMDPGDTCFQSWEHESANEFEVGEYEYDGGGSFTIVRIHASSNGGNAVAFTAGTKRVYMVMPASRMGRPIVQTFDASGTWTKPPDSLGHMVRLWGAGAGGMRPAAGEGTAQGGKGGGGGAYQERWFSDSELAATVAVTIGAGGAGATDASDPAEEGGFMSDGGGLSQFGPHMRAPGGGRYPTGANEFDRQDGGGAVTRERPTGAGFGPGLDGAASVWGGGGGANSGEGDGNPGGVSTHGGPGGGSGGGVTDDGGPVFNPGGDGGSGNFGTDNSHKEDADDGDRGGGAAGGATEGASGADATARGGGGGGAAGGAGGGGNGGNGFHGGGGGGGGGALAPNTPGNGGNGGNGYAEVWSF